MAKKKNKVHAVENRIIAALDADEKKRLLPHLKEISFKLRHPLIKAGETIRNVYFPTTAVLSIISESPASPIVEIATVGNEGMLGIPVFLGATQVPAVAYCQVPGMGLELSVEAFLAHLNRNGASMQRALRLYTQALFNQIGQSVVCNRIHQIEQRCCRWLLMTHDRVRSDQFNLTQEFLAQMLGVRRASVNDVAKTLQKSAMIRYKMGIVEILDRRGLEELACSCYRIVRDELNRLDPRKQKTLTKQNAVRMR